MKYLFKFSIAIILSLPVIGYTNWDEDKICLQTLICNVNGALLKDNKDNRACIGSALAAGVSLGELDDQESDTPIIMCLSRETIISNPKIDYQANRIDIIPPVEEIPEYPQPPTFTISITVQRDLGSTQTPEMYDNRGNPEAYREAVRKRDLGIVPGYEHLQKMPGETPEAYYNRINGHTPAAAAPAAAPGEFTVEFPRESKGDSGVINETKVMRIEPNINDNMKVNINDNTKVNINDNIKVNIDDNMKVNIQN